MDKIGTLQPTKFFDFNNNKVKKKAEEIIQGIFSEQEMAIKLFYWVRDEIKYNMYTYIPMFESNLRASTTLRRKNGFCMSKAILLSTFARAIGIPARIHMVDIINHKVPDWIEDFMGTKTFHCHGYSELYLNGDWIKLTPVFDKNTALKAGYLPLVQFNGEDHALLSPYDEEGNKFIEYVRDWGVFDELPIKMIDEIFQKNYGKIYTEFLWKLPEKNK